VTDPDSTNNQASATIAAGALPDACVVPGLRGARLNAARRMLRELGCRVQVVHRHSRRRAGTVLSVRGGVRTYSFGTTITLVVSSGAGPHRRHR
jgi:beta-lactam-binding protein with PASTA domain